MVLYYSGRNMKTVMRLQRFVHEYIRPFLLTSLVMLLPQINVYCDLDNCAKPW